MPFLPVTSNALNYVNELRKTIACLQTKRYISLKKLRTSSLLKISKIPNFILINNITNVTIIHIVLYNFCCHFSTA